VVQKCISTQKKLSKNRQVKGYRNDNRFAAKKISRGGRIICRAGRKKSGNYIGAAGAGAGKAVWL
jgi:hypothetical protein